MTYGTALLPTPELSRARGHAQRDRRAAQALPDAGAATLELVVLFPFVMLLLFGAVQGALFFHGRNVLLAAAEQGVRAGRLDGQTDRLGVAAEEARQFLADTGELDNVSELSIRPSLQGQTVRLTVSGRTVSLLPGMPGPRISQSAAGAVERFTSRSEP